MVFVFFLSTLCFYCILLHFTHIAITPHSITTHADIILLFNTSKGGREEEGGGTIEELSSFIYNTILSINLALCYSIHPALLVIPTHITTHGNSFFFLCICSLCSIFISVFLPISFFFFFFTIRPFPVLYRSAVTPTHITVFRGSYNALTLPPSVVELQ